MHLILVIIKSLMLRYLLILIDKNANFQNFEIMFILVSFLDLHGVN